MYPNYATIYANLPDQTICDTCICNSVTIRLVSDAGDVREGEQGVRIPLHTNQAHGRPRPDEHTTLVARTDHPLFTIQN